MVKTHQEDIIMDEKELRKLAGLNESQITEEQTDSEVIKKLEKTLKQMEKFLGQVGRDQERGELEEGFWDGYDSAIGVWHGLLAKEFPGLKKPRR
jgi:hypothetical protein